MYANNPNRCDPFEKTDRANADNSFSTAAQAVTTTQAGGRAGGVGRMRGVVVQEGNAAGEVVSRGSRDPVTAVISDTFGV